MQARLCLNMIVKNEISIIERCLRSVADHIACWIIGDTGSTDGTPELIERFFLDQDIPGELHRFAFENFSQARNEALRHARGSSLSYDYLLLMDADMEFVAHDPGFRHGLAASAYRVVQRTTISYGNLRLLARDAPGQYQGVTHEYLDLGVAEVKNLSAVSFIDHASGSNRVDKFARDIRMLLDGIAAEPYIARYHFYLAESYRHAGRFAEAARTYAHRISLGGWEEEVWYAMLCEARCLRALGHEDEFIGKALAAWDRRPHRAEPLRDVANHYRMRGKNHAATMVAEQGLDISYPKDDVLFIEDDVYNGGLLEDYAISAWYSASSAQRARGGHVCNELSLSRRVPRDRRETARRNLAFYAPPLAELIADVSFKKLEPPTEPDWAPMNPSVTIWRGELWMVQRTVNFKLVDGHYVTGAGAPVITRNFLARLNCQFEVVSWAEILPPVDQPEPLFPQVVGYEDMRLIAVDDELWCSSTVRELNAQGWCEQLLARINGAGNGGACRLSHLQRMSVAQVRRHEKNWTPLIVSGQLRFIHSYEGSLLLSRDGAVVGRKDPVFAVDHLRGGSQAVPFAGGWLALCHEVIVTGSRRRYLHRFAWFDSGTALTLLSEPFTFGSEDIEFVAGLAPHPNGRNLVASYGVGDREPWVAILNRNEICRILGLEDQSLHEVMVARKNIERIRKEPYISDHVLSRSNRSTTLDRFKVNDHNEAQADRKLEHQPARHIIWLSSYPKSGSTWVRAFIHNLLSDLRGDDVFSINKMDKYTAWETPAEPFERIMGTELDVAEPGAIAAARPVVQRLLAASRAQPFLVKTHNAILQDSGHPTINLAATLAAVHIVRNPLDIAISYAYHSGRAVDDVITIMARSGAKSIISKRSAYEMLGSWSEHTSSWIGLSTRPVHLIRYEDLLADPVRHFGVLARFLGLSARDDQLRVAIERSTFVELARQEEAVGFRERPLSSDRFFRSGREGQWREALSKAQVRRMLDEHAPMMQRLGYLELTCGAAGL